MKMSWHVKLMAIYTITCNCDSKENKIWLKILYSK